MTLVAEGIQRKEVVITILGAATGLAGLVLVFLGILVSAFESYDREGKAAARPKFEPTAWVSVAAFALGLVALGLERAGAYECACEPDCWCKRPGLNLFRWVFPRFHRIRPSAGRAS